MERMKQSMSDYDQQSHEAEHREILDRLGNLAVLTPPTVTRLLMNPRSDVRSS